MVTATNDITLYHNLSLQTERNTIKWTIITNLMKNGKTTSCNTKQTLVTLIVPQNNSQSTLNIHERAHILHCKLPPYKYHSAYKWV